MFVVEIPDMATPKRELMTFPSSSNMLHDAEVGVIAARVLSK
jgi:hypothetical protein